MLTNCQQSLKHTIFFKKGLKAMPTKIIMFSPHLHCSFSSDHQPALNEEKCPEMGQKCVKNKTKTKTKEKLNCNSTPPLQKPLSKILIISFRCKNTATSSSN